MGDDERGGRPEPGSPAADETRELRDGSVALQERCPQTRRRPQLEEMSKHPADVLGGTAEVRAVQVDGGAAWSSPFFVE